MIFCCGVMCHVADTWRSAGVAVVVYYCFPPGCLSPCEDLLVASSSAAMLANVYIS